MANTTFSVTVEEKNQYYPLYEVSFDKQKEAVAQAKKWAGEHLDKQVFISFFRKSDGQQGFINQDGADVTGRSWT